MVMVMVIMDLWSESESESGDVIECLISCG